MKIPFFNYPRLYLDNKELFLKTIDEVASRGSFIMQKDLTSFENRIAKYVNSKFSFGVANATDGLEIGWMALGIKPGDEIICSAHTMVATASAIKMAGGTPIPVDIGEDNLIDSSAVDEAINNRTVGIMPTQLNGRTCNMDKIMEIADKYKLLVVEDAAQSLGSKFKNKAAGTFGDASAISFYPAKVLGCFGDGGIFLTNSSEIYNKGFQIHDHGRDPEGELKSWGRNSRLDNIQAAILNVQFNNYEKVIEKRRNIAKQYDEYLSHLEELNLPPKPSNGDHFDIYQNYEIEAKNRDELKYFLEKNGIGTLIQWGGKALHQWEPLGFNLNLPKAEEFFKKCIMLPMNVFLTNEEVKFISDKIIEFYRS